MLKKTYKDAGRAGGKVLLSLAISNGILLLGIAGVTCLIVNGHMPENMIHTASALLLFGASVMGGVVASAGSGSFWIPLAAFTAIQYLLLLLTNVVLFDGGLERIWIGTAIVIMGSGIAAGLKFIPTGKPRNRKYKRRFR